jgi:D-glycero-alpha-D-manno-heptose-7-phosphate kinase
MIIVQTPLRISFFGGGTDFPSFYLSEGGCVLSTAIDKYIFVTIKKRFDHFVRVGYSKTEMVESVDQLQHELIREALRKTNISQGVEITTMADIPTTGSGLGSSSTVTVGALHAMYSLLGELVPSERLAREACQIEIDTLGKPIGKQDQYIAAYGGMRLIEFKTSGEVEVHNIKISEVDKQRLSENLLLFYTGISRQSVTILEEQKENIPQRLQVLRDIKCLAYEAQNELQSGNLDAIGKLLHQGWYLKKQMASRISNETIDDIYLAARKAGAIGGKITGAGGGGFLLLYCPYERKNTVRAALNPLQELPITLEDDGSKIIFNYKR